MHPKRAERSPATPAPAIVAGITCPGSAAANGIAPSVMKEAPMMMFVIHDDLSAAVNFLGKSLHARAIPTGGTIPPAITAAIEINAALSSEGSTAA